MKEQTSYAVLIFYTVVECSLIIIIIIVYMIQCNVIQWVLPVRYDIATSACKYTHVNTINKRNT